MQERENILRIFRETKEAIEKKDFNKIRTLSNQTTNSASLTQDPDNIAAAVIVYSLGEILESEKYNKLKGWGHFYDSYLSSIDEIVKSLRQDNLAAYRKHIKRIRKLIDRLSGKLKEHIQEVFRRASINKASRIYDHGISMGITAKLLGVTLFELTDYASGKNSSEISQFNSIDVKNRIKFAMDMFK